MKKMFLILFFTIFIVGTVSAATDQFDINWIIPDDNPPTFDNLRNFTITVNSSFSESITASDDIGIDTYSLNDTSVFIINGSTGLITNSIQLINETIYWLNITVNDTSGNQISGIFFINVTVQVDIPRNLQRWKNIITGEDVATLNSSGNLWLKGNISATDGILSSLGIGINPSHQFHIVLNETDNFFIDGSTNQREVTVGAFRQTHTPAIPGTRALNYVIDVNNQADTSAIVTEYLARGFRPGDTGAIHQADIDTGNSIGGTIEAWHVEKTGMGLVDVHAVHAGPGVQVIHQDSGVFGNIESAFIYDGSFTDVTGDFNSTTSDVQMFVSNNDLVYIGKDTMFSTVEVILETATSGPGIKPVFEYFNGSWTSFGPADGTNGFRVNGNIVWNAEDLTGWTNTSVDGSNKFWIRIERTTVSLTTPPIEDTIKYTSPIQYEWTENGDLIVNGINMSGNLNADGDVNFTGGLDVDGNVIFQNNLTVDTIFANAINISSSSFLFSDNANNSINYFVENKNNGSNATSLMITRNDAGGLMGIGIGSSNYFLGSTSKPNITALFSRSMGETLFANFFNRAFVWMINPSNDDNPDNLVEVMRLDENGLNVSGNLTGDMFYGEMWNHSDATFTVDLITQQVYENITNLTEGSNHGFTLSNSKLTVLVSGVYRVDYSISFSGTANSEIGFTIGVNGLTQHNTHSHRSIGTGGDIGNTGGTGIITLSEGDVVTLMARDEASPVRDIVVLAANINMWRVGNV